jgi:hypothetical protein
MEFMPYAKYFQKNSIKKDQMMLPNTQITNKCTVAFYDVFYSQYFHQHISASILAIFRAMFLLHEHNCG